MRIALERLPRRLLSILETRSLMERFFSRAMLRKLFQKAFSIETLVSWPSISTECLRMQAGLLTIGVPVQSFYKIN